MSWLPIPQSFHYIRLHRRHCPYQGVILQSRKWRKQQQWIECAVKTDRKIKPLAHSMLDAQYLFISLGPLKEVCFHRSYLVHAQRNAYEPGVTDSTELMFSEAWTDAISRQVGQKWLVRFFSCAHLCGQGDGCCTVGCAVLSLDNLSIKEVLICSWSDCMLCVSPSCTDAVFRQPWQRGMVMSSCNDHICVCFFTGPHWRYDQWEGASAEPLRALTTVCVEVDTW